MFIIKGVASMSCDQRPLTDHNSAQLCQHFKKKNTRWMFDCRPFRDLQRERERATRRCGSTMVFTHFFQRATKLDRFSTGRILLISMCKSGRHRSVANDNRGPTHWLVLIMIVAKSRYFATLTAMLAVDMWRCLQPMSL